MKYLIATPDGEILRTGHVQTFADARAQAGEGEVAYCHDDVGLIDDSRLKVVDATLVPSTEDTDIQNVGLSLLLVP